MKQALIIEANMEEVCRLNHSVCRSSIGRLHQAEDTTKRVGLFYSNTLHCTGSAITPATLSARRLRVLQSHPVGHSAGHLSRHAVS